MTAAHGWAPPAPDLPDEPLRLARTAVAAEGLRWGGVRGSRLVLQPGRRTTRVLDLTVIAGAVGSGTAVPRTLVLTSSPLDPAGGRSWWLPEDPALPGLAAAADPEHVAAWLGGRGPLRSLTPLVYRPRERAVLAASWAGSGEAFLKVLPLHAVHPVHRRLSTAHAAGVPVPPPLAPPELGVLALGRVPGAPWRRLLDGPRAVALDPAAVSALLDALPPALLGLDDDDPPARPAAPEAAAAGAGAWAALLDHAVWAGGVLDAVGEPGAGGGADAGGGPVPADGPRRLADRARALLTTADAGPRVPVHGDLHPGNLHVDAAGTRIVGLLDADTLGPGHRADDWGALLGHLAAAAADLRTAGRSGPADALERVAHRYRARAEREADAGAVAARAAVTALALAAVPEAPASVRAARRRAAGDLLARVA